MKMQSDEMTMASETLAASVLPPATGSTHINVGMNERLLSVFGGAIATVYGFKTIPSPLGIALALGGTYLLVRGASGYCPLNEALHRNTAVKNADAMEVKEVFTVDKSRAEVYAFWRNFENLPRFMKHLKEVKEHDMLGHRTTWCAEVPGGLGSVTWEAEITEDIAGETLAWNSLPGSTIDNAGEIRFKDAPEGKGTIVEACVTYRLPAGDLGSVAGKLFNPFVRSMIREDLLRFKVILERGESPTSAPVTEMEKGKTRKKRQNRASADENKTEPFENSIH